MYHKHGSIARLGAFLTIALVVAALLGACGFHARGEQTSAGTIPSPLHIAGVSPFTDLHRELKRQLDAAGVEIAASVAEGAATLRIDRWVRDTRVLSVDSRNRAVEYELEESVTFTLRARDGAERLANQTEQAMRIQYRPPTVVLGSARESELLRNDMLRDVVGRVIRRVAAAK